MIGWMYHWGKQAPSGCPFAGALSVPRELYLMDGEICNRPVSEAASLLSTQSRYVQAEGNRLILSDGVQITERHVGTIRQLEILEDTKSSEVFVNGGEASFTYWLAE